MAHDDLIRAATAADTEAVLALWRRAESVPTLTDSAAGVERLCERDPGALLVAADGGRIVGSVIAAWDGWRGSFYRLAVDPAWRRRGLAGALVRAGERRLAGLGAVRLTAIAAESERPALALWASLGYTRQRERARFVRELD